MHTNPAIDSPNEIRPPLYLSVVLSGAISLGAYEAGAVAQLAHALTAWRAAGHQPPVIDLIAGASAGAVTGALLAHHLATGLPAAEFEQRLRELWTGAPTSLDDLLALTDADRHSLFSSYALERRARDFLSDSPACGHDLVLTLTLTNLDGVFFDVELSRDAGSERLRAPTYRDWITFRAAASGPLQELIDPHTGETVTTDWQRVKWAAMASAAFPWAFPPIRMRRQLQGYPPATVRAVGDPPVHAFAYADGGVVDNMPFGRAVDALRALPESHQRAPRLYLLIDPHPPASETEPLRPDRRDDGIADDPPLSWVAARVLAALREQSLYQDLHESQKVNQRLRWRDEELLPLLEAIVAALPESARSELTRAAAESIARVAARKAHLRQQQESPAALVAQWTGNGGDLLTSLRALVDHVAALRAKSPIHVARVHPDDARRRLAGEFLGHFGGFLDARFRQHDFACGAADMLRTLEAWRQAWWPHLPAPAVIETPAPDSDPRLANASLATVPAPCRRRYLDRLLRNAGRLLVEELDAYGRLPKPPPARHFVRRASARLLAMLPAIARMAAQRPLLLAAGLALAGLLGAWKAVELLALLSRWRPGG